MLIAYGRMVCGGRGGIPPGFTSGPALRRTLCRTVYRSGSVLYRSHEATRLHLSVQHRPLGAFRAQSRAVWRVSRLARLSRRVVCVLALASVTSAAHVAQAQALRGAVLEAKPVASAADATFMRQMILHHGQALEMTALIATRSARGDLRQLGERMTVSQRDEIRMMSRWLQARGEHVPTTMGARVDTALPMTLSGESPHARAFEHEGQMPGMLTSSQMDSLRNGRDVVFDQRFLRYMIQHHEGARSMVRRLLATAGAAQDPQVYAFAADVDAEQSAEIHRMQGLLQQWLAPPKGRQPSTRPSPRHTDSAGTFDADALCSRVVSNIWP